MPKNTTARSMGLLTLIGLLMAPVLGQAQGEPEGQKATAQQGAYKLQLPFGLEETAVIIPTDNPLIKEKVELRRLLFFDKRLSKGNTIACARCHMAQFAFTDGTPVSAGIKGLKGDRSAPASINRVFSSVQFWDGRAATLEEQSVGPFTNPVEHGFANYDDMIVKMKKLVGYQKWFQRVFGTDITIDGVGKAIPSFQRTILYGNSPADRFDSSRR